MSSTPEKGQELQRDLPSDRETTLEPMGRKNWLFVGSEEGGRTAAILFSITMTCRHLDIDPYAYLDDVLRRINTHPASRIAELLPDRWKQEREQAGADVSVRRLEDHRPLRRTG